MGDNREPEIPVIRLGRELAYEGTILKVYKDYVSANGYKAVWDFIHHDGAAAVLPVDENGKLLMVRQYRNALDRFTLEIPAGKVDAPDEPRRLCAFLARNLKKGEAHPDKDEVIEPERWELGDLLDLIYKGEIRDAKTVAAITAYAVMRMRQ